MSRRLPVGTILQGKDARWFDDAGIGDVMQFWHGSTCYRVVALCRIQQTGKHVGRRYFDLEVVDCPPEGAEVKHFTWRP